MTPEYRRQHYEHCRAYDKMYRAKYHDRTVLASRSRYWRNRKSRMEVIRKYKAKHRERLNAERRTGNIVESMVAEVMNG